MKSTNKILIFFFIIYFNNYFNSSALAQKNLIRSVKSQAEFTEDYRELFLGDYTGIVYLHNWFTDDTAYFDTIVGNINVSEFLGYIAGSDSNFIDIDHKLAVTYAPYDTTHDDSWCAWVNYYTNGFLHPTIDTLGYFSYPELTDCQNGFIEGFCDGDSIAIFYRNYNMWKGFTKTVRGKKNPTIIEDPLVINSQISVFPNPCKSDISINGINTPFKVIISDLNGKIQHSEFIWQNKLNVSKLHKGLYFLKISNQQDSKIFKIIKM